MLLLSPVYDYDGSFVVRYSRVLLDAVPAGWYDRTLKHPHRGRKKKV